jgi:hypothetical protein
MTVGSQRIQHCTPNLRTTLFIESPTCTCTLRRHFATQSV